MRLIGLFLKIAGALLIAGGLSVGLPFTGVYLLGFVGTSGREAGRELIMALMFTATVSLVGWLLLRLGRALRPARPGPPSG